MDYRLVYLLYLAVAAVKIAENVVSTNTTVEPPTQNSTILSCYVCGSTDSTECMTNVKDIRESSLNNKSEHIYARNCSSEFNQTFCMIEKIESNKQVVSYIRDCSDGVTFSRLGVKRLENIKPDNRTTCSYNTSYLMCVTLCDTSFCNGPHPINSSTFSALPALKHSMEMSVLFLFITLETMFF